MMPSLFHVPPISRGESHNTCAFAPVSSERLSLPFEPYAIDRLSGDQNGSMALSEPGRSVASGASILRTNNILFPSADVAVNAIFCPSGEITAASGWSSLKDRFGGGLN